METCFNIPLGVSKLTHFGSPRLPKWRQFGSPKWLISEVMKTSILETPHTVWKGPGSQKWTHFVHFSSCFPGPLLRGPLDIHFGRFWIPLGTQNGSKTCLKYLPHPHMSTMWTQSLPVGVLRSLQDPKMMLREPRLASPGPENDQNVTLRHPLNTKTSQQNTQNLTALGHHCVT